MAVNQTPHVDSAGNLSQPAEVAADYCPDCGKVPKSVQFDSRRFLVEDFALGERQYPAKVECCGAVRVARIEP